jgi:electron transfer flavoprotein beta subunit
MNIAVTVKQVVDTAAKIALNPEGSGVSLDGVQLVLNPYDEFAVEEGIKIKEKLGGEVVVFNIGPDSADEAVKTALAMGADRAVVLRDEGAAALDAAGTASCLAKMIGRGEFDLVLCGKQAVDSDTHQVGPALAQLLGLPAVTFATELEVDDSSATASRDAEGIKETITVQLPALISCQKGLNEPRYPSLPGIMQAVRKPKEVLSLSDLGLEASPKVTRKELYLPPARAEGKILAGEIPDQVKELVSLLRDEAKAI